MDLFLTVLFYIYLTLALSAPLLVIPAIVMCRTLSNPSWKGLVVLIPLVGLPLFSLLITLPKLSPTAARNSTKPGAPQCL